jgi:hypothetical protein
MHVFHNWIKLERWPDPQLSEERTCKKCGKIQCFESNYVDGGGFWKNDGYLNGYLDETQTKYDLYDWIKEQAKLKL